MRAVKDLKGIRGKRVTYGRVAFDCAGIDAIAFEACTNLRVYRRHFTARPDWGQGSEPMQSQGVNGKSIDLQEPISEGNCLVAPQSGVGRHRGSARKVMTATSRRAT
jgi:hypothetical protein